MAEKTHILMIDDDPAFQRLFGAKLATVGYEMLYAHDGETGREMARRFHPDLVLLDIRMPGTDGYTIAQRLHEEKQTKDIPVIFLTNEDMPLEAEKWAKEFMVKDYIHKSTDLNEFVERVKKVVKPKKDGKGEK